VGGRVKPGQGRHGITRHDFGGEEFGRAHRFVTAHQAVREIAAQIGRAGLFDVLSQIVAHLAPCAGDRVAMRLRRVEQTRA
jgi:hypothetical protein